MPRASRAADNGSGGEVSRKFIGSLTDLVKIIMGLLVGGAATGGGISLLNSISPEEIVLHDKVQVHMTDVAVHEGEVKKTARIRETVEREFMPAIKRLEEKLDELSEEVKYIKEKINQ